MDGVVAPPLAPALLDQLARFGVERDAEAERRARVGVVGRGHAEIHDRVAFLPGELLLLPHVVEEAPDAPVVQPRFELPVSKYILPPGFALRHPVLGELVQGVRPVVPVDEVEVRVARMAGDRAPVLRVLHAVEDRAVAARGLAEAAAMLPVCVGAELAIDEWNDLAREVISVIT